LVIARTTIKPGSPALFQEGCQIKSRLLQMMAAFEFGYATVKSVDEYLSV